MDVCATNRIPNKQNWPFMTLKFVCALNASHGSAMWMCPAPRVNTVQCAAMSKLSDCKLPGGSPISFCAHVKVSFALCLSIRCKCKIYGRYSQFAWGKMRMEFDDEKEKQKRQMRSTTITYFDVDMRMVLSIPKLRWPILAVSFRSTDAICNCSDYVHFGSVYMSNEHAQRFQLANVTENRFVHFFKV